MIRTLDRCPVYGHYGVSHIFIQGSVVFKDDVRHYGQVFIEKMDQFLPIVAEHNASVIGLAMDETGTPKSADKRVENAGMVVAKAMEYGIPMEHLFLDPIIMPLKYMQDQQIQILEAARQFKLFSDPPPHIVGGLSNVSNGTTHKKLINRTFLVMGIAYGMDAVICDVMDADLVQAARSAELVMNKEIYADSYV